LPEVSACLGSIPSIASLRSTVVFSMHSLGQTSEQHNDGTEEQTDHSSQDCPHSDGVERMTSASILVDVVLDDAEECEVACHGDNGDEPCDGSDHGGEDGTADSSAECEEEGNECKTTSDGVKDHDSGQGFRGIDRGGVEGGLVDAFHDSGGVIANVLWVAVILIGAGGSNIKNAVAESTKSD